MLGILHCIKLLSRGRHCLTFTAAWVHPPVFGGVRVAHRFSFLWCIFCFVCLRPVFCVLNVACYSGLSIFDGAFGFLFHLLTASFSGLSIPDGPFGFLLRLLTASFSGLSIPDCHFGFLLRLLTVSFSGLSIPDCSFDFL